MAAEAQLCPQCGGSIQFAAYEMQVICPHCGTTVDTVQPQAAGAAPLPPSASSIADLADDQWAQLKQLVFEGQRAGALAFIQQNLGLDEATANTAIDSTIKAWASAHDQTHMASALSGAFRSGQARPAVVQKVVVLSLAGPAANGTVITRLVLDVAASGQPPRVIERMMDLPRDMADRLKSGIKIEVVIKGTEFVYVTDPIKVLG